MYEIKDLFNQRSVFSAKLEQIMTSQSITKANLCKETGISRPTLDKLLAAELTSKTNFEKHVTKILNFLHMTPDTLMGNTHNIYNRMRQMKNALRISEESISLITGIDISRLKDIEAGAEATTAELRDIALCLQTSVRGLLGTNYFDIPIAQPSYCIKDGIFNEMNGFWGHIGILLHSNNEYSWFPISSDVRNRVYQMLQQQFIIIPCMNNKILLLNTDNIDNIILLDDHCDEPDFANWDSEVDEAGLPLVIYEALEDYFLMGDFDELSADISPKFRAVLGHLINEMQWTEEDIIPILKDITIHFKAQKSLSVISNLDMAQTLLTAIQIIFDFGELDSDYNMVYFKDANDVEIIVNLNNISMIELPLLAVEDAICHNLEEMSMDVE